MMHLDMTGRQVEITPALREFAEEKLGKLQRLLDGPLEVHVVLGIEKHRHSAEVQVKSKTAIFSGHMVTGDLYASIGEVADKLERQALKHKEKLHSHKHRKSPRDPEVAAAIEAEGAGIDHVVDYTVTNGGLDANWLNARGIPTVTLGCGQNNIHTVEEWLDLVEFHRARRIALRLATGE